MSNQSVPLLSRHGFTLRRVQEDDSILQRLKARISFMNTYITIDVNLLENGDRAAY